MKKGTRILSMVLAFTLAIGVFSGTAAFAEETTSPDAAKITFTDGFDQVKTVEYQSVTSYGVEVDKEGVTLTASTDNDQILSAHVSQDDTENSPKEYTLQLIAWAEGEATVTLKTSDGTEVSQKIEIKDTGAKRTYTISSDVSGNFSLPEGGSRIIKVHYEDYEHFSYPVIATDDQESSLRVQYLYVDFENNDYYCRVDAVGKAGQTGLLYLGSSDYIPDKLCTVTVTANKNLRLDTTDTYVCNTYDSYRFVAYTNAATPPTVTSFRNMLDVEYIGKVTGGYEYRMTANHEEGESLISATSNGETATFQVHINYNDPPAVLSDTKGDVSIAQGSSYTYKLTIMGGGEPEVTANVPGVANVSLVKKDGIQYYYKVTAVGKPSDTAALAVTFPESGDDSFNVSLGSVKVTPPAGVVMKSDTNSDFSLKQGASYTFKVSGATAFYPGSAGIFTTKLLSKSGGDSYYQITATGNAGQSTGFYMSVPGQAAQKVCVVTVAAPAPVVMKSDTNSNFSLKQGASYTFKISGATSFYAGSGSAFSTKLISKSGSDSYYTITATGQPGQQAGFYMSAPGQAAQKVCVVTVAVPQPVAMKSDTNSDFSLKQGASYTFKISGASAFYAGSDGAFTTKLVSKSGNDSYYSITATGQPGQKAGFYMSAPGQAAQKVCVVTVGGSAFTSDVESDFSLAAGESRTVTITAPGAKTVNLHAGTPGILQITPDGHTGDDFTFTVTGSDALGRSAGLYVSVDGSAAKKLCAVSVQETENQ